MVALAFGLLAQPWAHFLVLQSMFSPQPSLTPTFLALLPLDFYPFSPLLLSPLELIPWPRSFAQPPVSAPRPSIPPTFASSIPTLFWLLPAAPSSISISTLQVKRFYL